MRRLLVALLAAGAMPAHAARFPTNPSVVFQTSGCQRPVTVGDWYTSAASASTTRYGEFFVEITPSMAPSTIVIRDAESNGALDEPFNAPDPTEFELLSGDGLTVLATRSVPPGSADGTEVAFAALAEGLYRIRSYTGSDEAPSLATGAYCDQAAGDNDDDNGFDIQVGGASANDGLLGFLRTTYQQGSGAPLDYQMYFVVGPALADSTLQFRNFDLDGGAAGTVYDRPTAASVPGTVSGNGVWNGGGTLNAGADDVVAANGLAGGAAEAGVWGYRIEGWSSGNQTIFEALDGGMHQALTDTVPTRAGFFTLTPSGTLATPPGVPVDHPFTVTNLFFANDIVNFTLSGTAAGYGAELRSDPDCDGSAADGAALSDTDADGALDSGLLTITGTPGATKCFALRVTPGAGAAGPDTTTIGAVSFLDARVDAVNNTTRVITKTTTLAFAALNLAKSVAVISDPFNGTTAPARISGSVLEYTIVVAAPAAEAANTIVLTDPIPAGMTYAPGSLTIGGAAEDDGAAGNGDFGVTTPGAVTARVATLAAGTSIIITFRATID